VVVEALVLFDSLLFIGLDLLTLTLPSHGPSFTLFIYYLFTHFEELAIPLGYRCWLLLFFKDYWNTSSHGRTAAHSSSQFLSSILRRTVELCGERLRECSLRLNHFSSHGLLFILYRLLFILYLFRRISSSSCCRAV